MEHLCVCAAVSPPSLSIHHHQMFSAWSSSVTSNSVLLFLAQVMGAYFISVVLLIRMAMPPNYRSALYWLLALC